MKPTIGRIVIIHQPSGEQIAGIVTQVHTDDCINISGFIPNGNVSGFSSITRKGVAPEGSTAWDWPEREGELIAAAAPLEPYGGFNLFSLLGGDFASVAGPLIVLLYQTNRGRIEGGSDRIMTPPDAAVDYALDRLGIKDQAARADIHQAVKVWGDKGGDVLVKIADAKAGG